MTTDFQDDLADGGGNRPTPDQVRGVRDHLKRHNRNFSVRGTQAELAARNFDISIASVQRYLNGVKGGNPPPAKLSPTKEADRRLQAARDERKREAKAEPKPQASPLQLTPDQLKAEVDIPKIAALIAKDRTSTQLAIEENRARMALNIVIANQMAARPELLLLDMRGTAALVDALTVGAKLSGGASIDITVPTDDERRSAMNGKSPEGHEMKDVTPKSALVMEIDKWRSTQRGP